MFKSKLFFCVLFSLVIFFGIAKNASAASPALNFSDLTSGPKSGLNDGLGQGTIVTIWGNNLGSSQGSSKVYFKDSAGISREAAYVYEWTNANQHNGHPSDLYTYHKMQDIMFSIPAGSADGAGTIYVSVGGANSNTLPFTVRAGEIYWVKNGGSNSVTLANNSWETPWASVDYAAAGAASKISGSVAPGSIVYIYNVSETVSGSLKIDYNLGTVSNPVAYATYPGTSYIITGGGFKNYMGRSENLVFSKIKIITQSSGINAFKNMRAIGCEITDAGGNTPGTDCPGYASAAFEGAGEKTSGVKCFGNYVHDYGCDADENNNQDHVFYLSNRTGGPFEAYEVGWNYITDNQVGYGYHVFDQSPYGGYMGIIKFHDNVAVRQRRAGLHFSVSPEYNNIDAYNNLLIDCGQDPSGGLSVEVSGGAPGTHVRFYNNTIYGGIASGDGAVAIYNSSAQFSYLGTWEWVNNIVVDTKNIPFSYYTDNHELTLVRNNIWYNGGDGNPASPPSWDTNPITSNPLFVNPSLNNFALQSTSPAINAGSSLVSSIVNKDFFGLTRPQGAGYDIGAFEYDENTPADAVVPNAPSGLSVR